MWANSGCGSHYYIENNKVVWAGRIDPNRHSEYAQVERTRLIASNQSRLSWRFWLKRVCRILCR